MVHSVSYQFFLYLCVSRKGDGENKCDHTCKFQALTEICYVYIDLCKVAAFLYHFQSIYIVVMFLILSCDALRWVYCKWSKWCKQSDGIQGKIHFKWTKDEAELLLNVTDKVIKITKDVDWESVKTKYDIQALMKGTTADEAIENWQKITPTQRKNSPKR